MCYNNENSNNIVIGNGLIASYFKKYLIGNENLVIFASGVSNSNETFLHQYNREKKLIVETLNKYKYKQFIYFSSISIFDSDLQHKDYVKFKKEIEFFLSNFENTTIIRTSNIVGHGGNSNTLINFFINSLINKQKVELWKNTERNLLGIDDFIRLTLKYLMLNKSKIVNIFYPISYNPVEIFNTIEFFLNLSGEYEVKEKGNKYIPKISTDILNIYNELNIEITQNYLNNLLFKYFANKKINEKLEYHSS